MTEAPQDSRIEFADLSDSDVQNIKAFYPNGGLVAALARCQAKFPAIVKSHTNPAFKGSQYADVADVLDAVRPVLAAEGLVITQPTKLTERGTVLVTKLMHVSGGVLESEFLLPVEGLSAQQVGSLFTYHKRYQACAICGVHPVGDDDDGNLAATAPPRQRYNETAPSVGASSGATTNVPDDWETRPLLSMTFTELRAVAERVGHAFSGGSKSELVRQLQPIMDARTGAEPF